MGFIVFNVAHREANIRAKGPSVRILGRFSSLEAANEFCKTLDGLETRIWPTSEYVNSGLPMHIHWRPITNVNLSRTESPQDVLEAEYSQIPQRASDWTAWRTSIFEEVHRAAEDRTLRPLETARAETMLHEMPKTPMADTHPATDLVPAWPKDRELRDQVCMIVGLIGDVTYETQKKFLLQELGSCYYDVAKQIAGPDAESVIFSNPEMQTKFFDALRPYVNATREKLDLLVQEPMIAFFDVSFDEGSLMDKLKLYGTHPDMRHVDLAIVRLYSWLRLDLGLTQAGIKHDARGTSLETSLFNLIRNTT
jgi:hypothetical protein